MIRTTPLKILRKLQQVGIADRQTLLAGVAKVVGGYMGSWGNSYFLPNAAGNGWASSLIGRGYIQFVGISSKNRKLYALTPRGVRILNGEVME